MVQEHFVENHDSVEDMPTITLQKIYLKWKLIQILIYEKEMNAGFSRLMLQQLIFVVGRDFQCTIRDV